MSLLAAAAACGPYTKSTGAALWGGVLWAVVVCLGFVVAVVLFYRCFCALPSSWSLCWFAKVQRSTVAAV